MSLETRIRKLEQAVAALQAAVPRHVIIGLEGETEAQARARLGIASGEAVLFVAVASARR